MDFSFLLIKWEVDSDVFDFNAVTEVDVLFEVPGDLAEVFLLGWWDADTSIDDESNISTCGCHKSPGFLA